MNNNEKNVIDSLFDDTDFKKLVKLYESPNFFRVIGKSYREEWHSGFLCWLLDPTQNHGLGIIPLKFFFELYSKKQNESGSFNRMDISSMTENDYEKFDFTTEYSINYRTKFGKKGRVDIFGKNDKAILVIENKVKSREHDTQTVRYYDYFNSEGAFKDKQKYFVYLCVDKDDKAQDSHYVNITYQDLYDYVIRKCIEYNKSEFEGRVLLEQYAINLSNPLNDVVMAHTCRPLCERIYNKHQSSIELIRKIMSNSDRDENSYVCRKSEKYIIYLNEVLYSLDKPIIVKVNTRIEKLQGRELVRVLCENGIIKPNETEFILEQYGMVFIVKVIEYEGEYKCISGYCKNYDGKEDVNVIYLDGNCYFSSLTDAVDAAVKVYKNSIGESGFDKKSGPGSTPLRELNSGKSISELKKLIDM